MGNTWLKIALPVLERIALTELALRHGETEEALLAQMVRDAVRQELLASPASTAAQIEEANDE